MSQWPRIDLDDAAGLLKLDSLEMLRLTGEYPAQFQLGLSLARSFVAAAPAVPVHRAVVLGTGGGSAATVQLLRAWLAAGLRGPLELVQGYDLPGYVDAGTLCIAISHSGNTEEILTTFAAAGERGCPRCAITAGGKLGAMAAAAGVPVLSIPGGMMPRIAVGLLIPALARVLAIAGLAPDVCADRDLWDAVGTTLATVASDCAPSVPVQANPAKQLALAIGERLPLVYGGLDLTWAAALRWKNQFGENSKRMAFWNAVPQLHHDEAVGWETDPALMSDFAVILLRDGADSDRLARRWNVSAELLATRAGALLEPEYGRGRSDEPRLVRLLRLVMFGDYVSIYLALAGGIDPTPVRIIDLFKRRMLEAERA